MSKPIYLSRKFWTAVVTVAAYIVSRHYDPMLADTISYVGMTLLAGLGLEDVGKAGKLPGAL